MPRPFHWSTERLRAWGASVVSAIAARTHRLGSGIGQFEPDLWRNLGHELKAGRHWLDRAVVLAYAVLTGAVVVVFTLLAEAGFDGFEAMRGSGWWGPMLTLAWTPAITVGVLWWTRRFAPATAGSGIPQVVRALDDTLAPTQRRHLVSFGNSLHKIGLVTGGLFAGLSVGREGPTVQVGAGIMLGARRWLSPHSGIDAHDLMVAGAAAGIAAAFNTPLGGIVFALEQLSRRRNLSHSTLVIASSVVAGLVAVSFFGNETYFGRLSVQQLPLALLGPALAVALIAGLAGGLFSRLIVVSMRGLPDRFSRWRATHPYRFAAGCALGVAVIGLATGGMTSGAGHHPTKALLEGQADLPPMYTLLKFCATWLSAWSGVPGGVFAPSLAIGAGIGHEVASFAGISRDAAIPLVALGMVGFLSATTAGPITAFIIVMEMVGGQSMVLGLMASAMIATGVARLISRSMYDELAILIPLPADSRAPQADGAEPGRAASVWPPATQPVASTAAPAPEGAPTPEPAGEHGPAQGPGQAPPR